MQPGSLKASPQGHLGKSKTVHKNDLADGWSLALPPGALDRKCPNAPPTRSNADTISAQFKNCRATMPNRRHFIIRHET
jgi:hypothetical protein